MNFPPGYCPVIDPADGADPVNFKIDMVEACDTGNMRQGDDVVPLSAVNEMTVRSVHNLDGIATAQADDIDEECKGGIDFRH